MDREECVRFATKYTEDLLSFFGLNVAVDSTVDGEVIKLMIPSTSANALLIGKDAKNLKALQHMVNMALAAKGGELNWVNIDIAEYRQKHNEIIEKKAEGWIRNVRKSGKTMEIADLNPEERRTIHKLAEEFSGVKTYSKGDRSNRILCIEATNDDPEAEEL